MSSDHRFEALEQQVIEALRRAPGPEPASSLDARILARAHAAVAAPAARRRGPRWLGLAASLMVLVGSGLALQIWRQLEHAPSPLDAPPARTASQAAEPVVADRVAPAAAPAPIGESRSEPRIEVSGALLPKPASPSAEPAKRSEELAKLEAQSVPTEQEADQQKRDDAAPPAAMADAASGFARLVPAAKPAASPPPASAAERAVGTDEWARQQSPADTGSPAPAPIEAALATSVPESTSSGFVAEPPAPGVAVADVGEAEAVLAQPAPPPADAPAPAMEAGAGAADRRLMNEFPDTPSIAERIVLIREWLAAGERKQALDELRQIRQAYPDEPLPADLQALLDRGS